MPPRTTKCISKQGGQPATLPTITTKSCPKTIARGKQLRKTIVEVVVSDEEKKWWETKRTTSGAEVAHGNACHECWCKKEELFPFLSWDELVVKKNAGDKTIEQILNDGVSVGKALPCEKVIGAGGM
eukprot:6470670-Amphidinium_carterae.1